MFIMHQIVRSQLHNELNVYFVTAITTKTPQATTLTATRPKTTRTYYDPLFVFAFLAFCFSLMLSE
jgi:hypothetical protein